jgi:AmmeMemoRadiSam system protein B
MLRRPAVAGMFYEGSAAALQRQVSACFAENAPVDTKEHFIGAVVPHAGLMYSGHVAAAVYARLLLPKRLIILCPNHTGLGAAAAINTEGTWATPLGNVAIDEELAAELKNESRKFEIDTLAHAREHSLEVQLPFLQILDASFRFVPICLRVPSYELAHEVGMAIAKVVARHRARGEEIGIIASSDLNHYEDQRTTLKKDQLALGAIVALDPRKLWDTILSADISMCGFIPTTSMLIAAIELGAREAVVVKHATSGDVSGDYDHVVGYAGIVIR